MAARKTRKPPANKSAETKENQELVEPLSANAKGLILALLDQAPIRGKQARELLEVRQEVVSKSVK